MWFEALADSGHTCTGQKENGFMAHCQLAADHSSDTGFGRGCVEGDFHVGTGSSEGLKHMMSLGSAKFTTLSMLRCSSMPDQNTLTGASSSSELLSSSSNNLAP